MGQSVSRLICWFWCKLSRARAPAVPQYQWQSHHDEGDNEEYGDAACDLDIDVYARDPELGVEGGEEGYESGDGWCEEEQGKKGKSKKRWMGPYNSCQKILLVGEGDFSFSASLALAFGDSASNITATSLDSLEFLGRNYSKAVRNVVELTKRGCRVMHGMDATRMAKHAALKPHKFDRIIFNFPHAGFFDHYEPRHMQISRHQALVKGFLANAKKLIKEDGEIHITQKTSSFFREWNVKMLASLEGLRLVGKAPFEFQHYRGYRTKFGYGGDDNFICYPCNTYVFQLA